MYSSDRKRRRDDDQYDYQTSGGRGPRGRPAPRGQGYGSSPSRGPARGNGMTAGEAFKNDLWKMGERGSDTRFEEARLDNVRRVVADVWVSSEMGRTDVLAAFTTAMTDLPHKHFYFATLLALLSAHPVAPKESSASSAPKPQPLVTLTSKDNDAAPVHLNGEDAEMTTPKEEVKPSEPEKIYIGHLITSHLAAKLERIVEVGSWLEVRLSIQFMTLLSKITSPLISPSSLLEVLGKLCAVFEDESKSLSYKDQCAKTVAMALLLLEGKEGDDLKQLLRAYSEKRNPDPDSVLFGEGNEDFLHSLLSAVQKDTITLPFADPISEHPELALKPEDAPEPINLSLDKLPEPVKNGSTFKVWTRLFEDETVPESSDPRGILLRSLIIDMMDVFESNRRECARLLLELGNGVWVKGRGQVLKQKARNDEDEEMGGATWVLDNVFVECLLDSLLALPTSTNLPPYYASLLVELCTQSPATVAPAMGKCVRKLYAGLGAGPENSDAKELLDPEGLRKFAEWFAMHLSNYNFVWRWPEWEGDLTLPATHPKRVFVCWLLETEVRLSYYDRIKNTLPDSYRDAGIMSGPPPEPEFPYDDAENPHHTFAQQLQASLRERTTSEDILEQLSVYQGTLQSEQSLPEELAASTSNDIALQCILLIGSKSFSHFLNVIERYIVLLRSLASSPNARQRMLHVVATFFAKNQEYIFIVIDKMLQYRIVEAIDVVEWAFQKGQDGTHATRWCDVQVWEVLRATVIKVNGRLKNANARVEGLRLKEKQATLIAETDDAATNEAAEELTKAERQASNVADEQKEVVLTSARRFAALVNSPESDDEFAIWWCQGWLRQFARGFAHLLHLYKDDVQAIEPDTTAAGILHSSVRFAEEVL